MSLLFRSLFFDSRFFVFVFRDFSSFKVQSFLGCFFSLDDIYRYLNKEKFTYNQLSFQSFDHVSS